MKRFGNTTVTGGSSMITVDYEPDKTIVFIHPRKPSESERTSLVTWRMGKDFEATDDEIRALAFAFEKAVKVLDARAEKAKKNAKEDDE